ncbi:hypothetical protein DDZ18_01735 [Marinicauda salina]|uniref:Uncharacterized protein n=1 Tax=Marinicauda salina TaxID=2135793 RepID=A0A2U2BWH4_9PROT|nr:DsrE family protein [Marinicauda salina]PWE18352.1 hypothetical protein DDZ18_01735 [Marinicauda salina]
MLVRFAAAAALGLAAPGAASAQTPDFTAFAPGPVFPEFSRIAPVETDVALPEDAAFKVSYDVNTPAEPGGMNRTLVAAARFIDMHVNAGVPVENIDLAVVVHGRAVFDVASPELYAETHDGADHANAALVAALIEEAVTIQVCGQSAVVYGVDNADLLPGVEMALSAMTAHALLQQDGYTLNPF